MSAGDFSIFVTRPLCLALLLVAGVIIAVSALNLAPREVREADPLPGGRAEALIGSGWAARALGRVVVQPVCAVAHADPDTLQRVNAWNACIALYFGRQWDEAQEALQQLRENPGDRHLAGIYLQRISLLRHDDPGEGWDGAFQHESK